VIALLYYSTDSSSQRFAFFPTSAARQFFDGDCDAADFTNFSGVISPYLQPYGLIGKQRGGPNIDIIDKKYFRL